MENKTQEPLAAYWTTHDLPAMPRFLRDLTLHRRRPGCTLPRSGIFGSRARRDCHPTSDYDYLAFLLEDTQGWGRFVTEQQEEAGTLLSLDLVNMDDASAPLREAIMTSGVVLYVEVKRVKNSVRNFSLAVASLEEFLAEPVRTNRDKAGIIQAFEYTYELAWENVSKTGTGRRVAGSITPTSVFECTAGRLYPPRGISRMDCHDARQKPDVAYLPRKPRMIDRAPNTHRLFSASEHRSGSPDMRLPRASRAAVTKRSPWLKIFAELP